ncbi:hypothetical protein [Xenorhabdus nematophila]|nr:hypothetical protein [Xenorhabdus nematophila]
MKITGTVVITIGVILAIFALTMNVSVDTAFGRVNNIGLMEDRHMYTIVSLFIVAAGLALLIAGSFMPNPATAKKQAEKTAQEGEHKNPWGTLFSWR